MENRKIIQSFVFFGFVAAFAAFAADKEQQDQVSPAEQSAPAVPKWGSYTGEPVTKWNPDGRTMTLLTELRYTDPNGNIWIAPIGSIVDGASIPRYLWSFMGGPFAGRYRNAVALRH